MTRSPQADGNTAFLQCGQPIDPRSQANCVRLAGLSQKYSPAPIPIIHMTQTRQLRIE